MPVGGFLLLCDFAEEINGKLYIMGGGWSRITIREPGASMAIAAKLQVPSAEATSQYKILLRLVSEDGKPVPDADGQPVELSGRMDVGRRIEIPPGTDVDLAVVFRIERLEIEAGRFRWELLVNDELSQEATFDVIRAD
jgi:hypothetical protein